MCPFALLTAISCGDVEKGELRQTNYLLRWGEKKHPLCCMGQGGRSENSGPNASFMRAAVSLGGGGSGGGGPVDRYWVWRRHGND